MTLQTTLKPRKCEVKTCRQKFRPYTSFITWCSPECGFVVAQARMKKKAAQEARKASLAAKLEKRQHRARKEQAKAPDELKAQVQRLANQCARIRDALDGCISCDKPATWDGQWHGSHYKTTGANSALRFNLWNIHKACSVCNHHKSGNMAEYKPRLIEKVGQERVDWLDSHERTRRYPVEWLVRAKKVFSKLVKRYKRRLKG